MFLSYLQTDEHFTFLKLKIWILVIFKAALAIQMWLSFPYKPLSFQTLRHSQFLSNFQPPKFKFSRKIKTLRGFFLQKNKRACPFIREVRVRLILHFFLLYETIFQITISVSERFLGKPKKVKFKKGTWDPLNSVFLYPKLAICLFWCQIFRTPRHIESGPPERMRTWGLVLTMFSGL